MDVKEDTIRDEIFKILPVEREKLRKRKHISIRTSISVSSGLSHAVIEAIETASKEAELWGKKTFIDMEHLLVMLMKQEKWVAARFYPV